VTISRRTAAASAIAIFAAGSGATYLLGRRAASPAAPPPAAVAPAPETRGANAVIRIPADVVARAGIRVEPAGTAVTTGAVRVPGTVQPNAYRQVSVTPLVGGRITRVLVELGQAVKRGQPIAEVYSPEADEARARFLSTKADTEAGEARLARTERLVALGSASQQELEQVRAEHVRHQTELRQAGARLKLLGIDAAALGDPHAQATSIVTVTAPQGGVITGRPATTGMTVEPATVLATIAELSPVWIIADVYERDFAQIATGAAATASSGAYAGAEWRGRVTYIAPDVRPETRTAQVRIEVPNPDGRLKFGMFVDATIAGRAASGVSVPASAVQTIGADAIVFVPDGAAPNAFRERRVKVGRGDGERVAITEGLTAGEPIVTRGSFELRAEAERQGVRTPTAQAAVVAITAAGFEPAALELQAGVPARITFTRKTDQTCATEVAIPAYGIRRALPRDTPVTVDFEPATGRATFQCGMGMLSGTLVVR
jgi:RND family efflux transporter MFP subunit